MMIIIFFELFKCISRNVPETSRPWSRTLVRLTGVGCTGGPSRQTWGSAETLKLTRMHGHCKSQLRCATAFRSSLRSRLLVSHVLTPSLPHPKPRRPLCTGARLWMRSRAKGGNLSARRALSLAATGRRGGARSITRMRSRAKGGNRSVRRALSLAAPGRRGGARRWRGREHHLLLLTGWVRQFRGWVRQVRRVGLHRGDTILL